MQNAASDQGLSLLVIQVCGSCLHESFCFCRKRDSKVSNIACGDVGYQHCEICDLF